MASDQVMDLMNELRWRGFLEAATSEKMTRFFAEQRRTVYAGFDPTADSLHLGHLIPVMALAHVQRHGHRPLVLVGGGTALIGDPSGKVSERSLLDEEQASHNARAIRLQLSKFVDLSSDHEGLILDNLQWLLSLELIPFLRDIGKHFSVNEMIKRDSVRLRLEEREQGISYTEFSYMLLQAYDFLHLCRRYDCTVQVGGSDQWGNILAGRELIRRLLGRQSEGITFPLLTTSTGKKFGKTEEGSVWLDGQRTSAYKLYQYWLQTADDDVVRYLKLFTFLDEETIGDLSETVRRAPEKRKAQRVLASECASILHGRDTVTSVETASRILFQDSDELPSAAVVDILANEIPVLGVERSDLLEASNSILDFTVRGGLVDSKGAARRLIEGGGLYLNNVRVTTSAYRLTAQDVLWPAAILLRSGKKNYCLIRVQ